MAIERARRVAHLIRKEVNSILRKEMKDPHLGFLTITEVTLTSDLQHAKVFYTVYGSQQEKASTEKLLKRMAPFVRYHIGKKVRLRYTPEIIFQYDDTIERAARINDLLDKIRQNESKRKGNNKEDS